MKLEFSEGKNTLCLPHKTDVAQSQTQKQRSKRTETKSTKRKNERGNHLCVPGKMNMIFFGDGRATLRLPRRMDVAQFIGGCREKHVPRI
jgi:hypothetical protein